MTETFVGLSAAAATQADVDNAAAITALGKEVTALTARVVALETSSPPIDPPPIDPPIPLDESADGATITAPGPKLVVLGVSWELVASTSSGLQLKRNGTVLTVTSQVVTGLRWSDLFYQCNKFNNWYVADAAGAWKQVAGDPRLPPPQPVPAGVPPQAAAAGYTHVVLNTDFISGSEVADWGSSVAAPWYTGGPDGARWINNGDYLIANSVLSLHTSRVSYSANLSSARGSGAAISTPGAIVTPNNQGRFFHYGFFEAKMRFNNTRGGGPGWPSFWGTSLNSSPNDHLEIDFVESQGPLNSVGQTHNGFLNWFDGQNDPGAFGQFFGALGATGYPNWGTVIANCGIDQNGGWNIFSCLWTPTKISFYWTSWLLRQAGRPDYLVCSYPTTTPLKGMISNDSSKPVTTTLQGEANPFFFLILGSSTGSGTEFDWVRVWQ